MPEQNNGRPEIVQVCMHAAMLPAFRHWLDEIDAYLYPIPTEEPIPTYGIGVRDRNATVELTGQLPPGLPPMLKESDDGR